MSFVKIDFAEFQRAFSRELQELWKKRQNSKSKFRNDPEEKFEYGLNWCEGGRPRHSFTVECRHVDRTNTFWWTAITSGPNAFPKKKDVYKHYNLSLPDFLKKNRKSNLSPKKRMKLPDVKVMAYEHVGGMYAGLKKLTVEHPDVTADFLVIDEANQKLLLSFGSARPIFYERLEAAKVGDNFIYRRKYQKIDPAPYLSWPVDESGFTVF